MIVHLKRFSYAKTETEGVLHVDGLQLATIERPWIKNPNGALGGLPNESCIPDGMYQLAAHRRPNGEIAFIIWNPGNGVYRYPTDHEEGKGRDLILIHIGNYVTDVVGCIAPGLRRSEARRSVEHSLDAMNELRHRLAGGQHILSITNDTGAKE